MKLLSKTNTGINTFHENEIDTNTRINTFHGNEIDTRSPREATKLRPNVDQYLRRQPWPFVGALPTFLHSVVHVEGRGAYLDEQDFQSCVTTILHMMLQVVASFYRIKTLRKGKGLSLVLNLTKGRENEVF